MLVNVNTGATSANARLLDVRKTYIVTALYFTYSDEGDSTLKYMVHANLPGQGGLPGSIDDREATILDGYLPPHWIATQQIDNFGRKRTVITYPEWANDPDYYQKMDDNESDASVAVNRYGEELRALCNHYQDAKFDGLSLEAIR